jgi:hypothetical protein
MKEVIQQSSPKELTVSRIVKLSIFYGTSIFITMFTNTRY